MNHLFLAGLLHTCLAISVRPHAPVDHERGACRDAAPGEWCHAAVTWARETGFQRRPHWFPGDASQYSFEDFQALLHRLGEAECPRPCSPGSAGHRPALGLFQLQSSAVGLRGKGRAGARRRGGEARGKARREAGADRTHGLRPAELAAVAEAPWRPGRKTGRKGPENHKGTGQKARAATLAAPGASVSETDSETSCQDAQPGSMCHHAAAWLHDEGLAKYPTWYPSLSVDSTMQEVQSVLHDLGKAHCPRPCRTHAAKRLEQSPDDRVLEVDGNGRQVLSEAYELSGPTDCGTAVEGDWCYVSIMWLKNEGLQKHPEWYPALTRKSSIEDFQVVLHNGGKVSCPLPCASSSTAPAELPQAMVSHSAVKVNAEMEECRDARKGSRCYKAITRILDGGLHMHPEEYPELTAGCSRSKVQEHLYLLRQYECGRPCPNEQVDKHLRDTRVQKSVEDMTARELARFLNHEWDGYVDADEYTEAAAAEAASAVESAEDASAKETLPLVNEEAVLDPSETQDRFAGDLLEECRDASVGGSCHREVTWAQTVGIIEHPKWYPGLSTTSSFKEIQAFIHKTRGRLCQMPCQDATEGVWEEALPIVNTGATREPFVTDEEALLVVADEEAVAAAEQSATAGAEKGKDATAGENATADAAPPGSGGRAEGIPSEEAVFWRFFPSGVPSEESAASGGEAGAGHASEEADAQAAGDAAAVNGTEVASDTEVANDTQPDAQREEVHENDEIARLRAENARLRAEAEALRARQAELAARGSAPEAGAVAAGQDDDCPHGQWVKSARGSWRNDGGTRPLPARPGRPTTAPMGSG